MTHLIAITGGIGSGKSVVSRILEAMGHKVYDCDSKARALIDGSTKILERIAEEICQEAVCGNTLDRKRLAQEVFSDEEKLNRLNKITHSAVLNDIAEWANSLKREKCLFIETAILYQSGLDRVVDEVWDVSAPYATRIDRAMKRDNASRQQIEARVKSQDSFIPDRIHKNIRTIVNDNATPILPQIISLLGTMGKVG